MGRETYAYILWFLAGGFITPYLIILGKGISRWGFLFIFGFAGCGICGVMLDPKIDVIKAVLCMACGMIVTLNFFWNPKYYRRVSHREKEGELE